MKNQSEFIKVGKVSSAQGIKGEIFVLFFANEASWIHQLSSLALGDESANFPEQFVTIKKYREHRKGQKWGLVFSLEGINDRNQAEAIEGKIVFVPKELLVSKEGETIFLREILQFKVVDQNRGEVGIIIDFAENGPQDLLIVKDATGSTFEVPLVKPILQTINYQLQQVIMDIPVGLLPGEEL